MSRSVPSPAHLSWLAYVEYRQLYNRAIVVGVPPPRNPFPSPGLLDASSAGHELRGAFSDYYSPFNAEDQPSGLPFA